MQKNNHVIFSDEQAEPEPDDHNPLYGDAHIGNKSELTKGKSLQTTNATSQESLKNSEALKKTTWAGLLGLFREQAEPLQFRFIYIAYLTHRHCQKAALQTCMW